MPVKPRKLKNRRSDLNPTILTGERYENLSSQIHYIMNGDVFPSPEARKICYLKNREEILLRWLDDDRNFCDRPFAWWEFEILPEREKIGEEKWWNPIDKNPPEWETSPIFENDAQFLRRLGVLCQKEMNRYCELETPILNHKKEEAKCLNG